MSWCNKKERRWNNKIRISKTERLNGWLMLLNSHF